MVIKPPKSLCDVGLPRDVEAITFVEAENNESTSVAVPLVIQFPKSTVIVPLPVFELADVKPENSKV